MKVKDTTGLGAALLPAAELAAGGRRRNRLVTPSRFDSKAACRSQTEPLTRFVVVACLVPLALSFTTGCSSGKNAVDHKATAAPLQVAGTVVLVGQHVDFGPRSDGNDCVGKGALSDVKDGAEVRISDGTGQTLGMSRLGNGIADSSTSDLAAGSCDFTFAASVPSGRGTYSIEVTTHGDQRFTEKQMAAPQLSLG